MISAGDISKAALWTTAREGGAYTEDPAPSKWGISQRYHPEFSVADIRAMTQDHAAAIFGQQYWMSAWNPLPQYFAVPLMSFAVLEGPGQACIALQRGLGVKADGNVGPQTLAAAVNAERDAFLETYFGACMARFMESPRWNLDGIGWCRRQFAAGIAAVTY